MKIITKKYNGTAGFHDLAPGVTLVSMCEMKTEDGKPIVSLCGDVPAEFNEIQTSGDKDLRISQLKNAGDINKILWLDDPDYDAKLFRRLNIATKNIPLSHDDDFVRGWLAMSLGNAELLDTGDIHKHPDGEHNWGGIDHLQVKKDMLNHIKDLPKSVRDELQAVNGNPQFVADYLIWWNSIDNRIKYKP